MITLPGALKSVLGDKVKRLANCWAVQRTDGVGIKVTDHNARLTVEAHHYHPASAVSSSALQRIANLRDKNQEVGGAITTDYITDADLRAGKYRDALVIQMLVDWAQPSAGPFYKSYFWVTSVEYDEEVWKVQLTGLSSKLLKPIGRVYNRLCDANLFDARCKLSPTSHTTSGEVTALASDSGGFGSDLSQADDYWNEGEVHWTSGNNAGLRMEVETFLDASGFVQLYLPMGSLIQMGDEFTIMRGCNKDFPTCRDRYNNIANFRGFPYIPGNDRLMFVPDAKA